MMDFSCFVLAVLAASSAGITTTTAKNTKASDVIPSYQFMHNGTENVCMLFLLQATLTIEYDTTDNETHKVTFPVSPSMPSDVSGSCDLSTSRTLLLIKPGSPNVTKHDYVARIWFTFRNRPDNTTHTDIAASWYYDKPLFPSDAVKLGRRGSAHVEDVITFTTGNTFKCESRRFTEGPVTFVLDHLLLQPYADFSGDKGHFGGVEDCVGPLPTKASPNDTGKIVGIALGTAAGIAIIVVVAVCVVKRRRKKKPHYNTIQ